MLTNSPVAAVLPAVDLTRAKKFYRNKLGLTQVMSDKDGVLLKAGKGTMIFIYTRKKTKAEHTVAAFMVKNIEKAMEELKKKGIKFENYNLPGLKTVDGIAESKGHKSAWFKDTEGNIIAIDQM
jgi:predicted enzyme related to lactoylglutathione lyase